MLCRPLLLVLLSILPQLSSSQEPDCAAAAASAPALLQADQRRDAGVHRNLTEETNSSHAIKHLQELHRNLTEETNSSHAIKKHVPKLDEKLRKGSEEVRQDEEEEDGVTESPYDSAKPKTNLSKSSTGAPAMPSYADIDVNKDGVLTPSEFQQKRGKAVANIEKQVKQVVEHEQQIETAKLGLEREIDEMPAYEDLDRDRDGVLTPAEYTSSSVTAMSKNLSYKALDRNADGAVTPGDFKDASEKWAAEVREQVDAKVEELTKAREERRKLEQDIDSIQSYKDLDKQRDGVITRSEYGQQVKAAHGTWGVEDAAAKEAPRAQTAGARATAKEAHQVQKAGSTATGLGFACLAILLQTF